MRDKSIFPIIIEETILVHLLAVFIFMQYL